MTIDEIKPGLLVRYDVDAYCRCYFGMAYSSEYLRVLGAVVFRLTEIPTERDAQVTEAVVVEAPHACGDQFFYVGDKRCLSIRVLIPYSEPLKVTRRLTVRCCDANH